MSTYTNDLGDPASVNGYVNLGPFGSYEYGGNAALNVAVMLAIAGGFLWLLKASGFRAMVAVGRS